jgi:hypothetical protein
VKPVEISTGINIMATEVFASYSGNPVKVADEREG